MKTIVELKDKSYPIYIEENALERLDELLPERNYFLLSDDGVPEQWVSLVAEKLRPKAVHIIPQGEASKSFDVLKGTLEKMSESALGRKDALVSVGGGVVGDLGGFAASIYMRGIDFYNIPTTILSQVDSSVGGKTAIDLGLYKNLVGAFWQPKAVVIDPASLDTLSERHKRNGLVEALKMGLILDADLIDEFEKETLDLEKIISRSVDLKRQVVQQDEKEQDLRRILNFGHTLGHAIEAAYELDYLHGECVAQGMLYFIEDPALKQRVERILKRLGLPEIAPVSREVLESFLIHDKKGLEDGCSVVKVDRPGHFKIETMSWKDILDHYEKENACRTALEPM